MAIYKANAQQDGYCYLCRQNVDPKELIQCAKCKNWFCKEHINLVEDPDSLMGDKIRVCKKDQGIPGF
ncbi:MAG: hypothetical protein COY11_01655 [Candidatus Portnoybacteria bacterium CG_4_10_14_0_2_um_filter_44_20]|uniref:Uncharacterized protein n=1 Tax=Candidatus Portnoybacteria bacterium CG_4_10_14_0_2_um_filter_44_20 TaxID=1974799 RepID=A0A2M7UJ16_9BACT|nr:MAG: hypothetical protein AUK17_00630 [Parcubacteria group bacterium CG2_30_44_18]PIZ71209.1 MAG: hypothetical protein COY11_01655 [Candidatus Portnoybacteria bacterium CG_4_10_14_0_2_um_filter_44_20]